MTIRDWVGTKIREKGDFDVDPHGEQGLIVGRMSLPPARVYCPEPSDSDAFTAAHLAAAGREMPALQFVVIVRRRVAGEAYTLADESGIAIGGMYQLMAALTQEEDVGLHKSAEQRFVQGRLDGNHHVQAFRRVGETVYEVTRIGNLSTVTIATTQQYELTADEVYELMAQNPEVDIDAVVTTNPNCTGFSGTTTEAVADACTRIMTFRDFLNSLRNPWD